MQPGMSFEFNLQGMTVRFHDAQGAITHSQHIDVYDCLRTGFDAHRLELMMQAGTVSYFYPTALLVFTDLEGKEDV